MVTFYLSAHDDDYVCNSGRTLEGSVTRSQKFKRPKLAMSSFKKGQILKNEKRPNKGQIFKENLLKQEKKIEEYL